jgi:hypothetical protein
MMNHLQNQHMWEMSQAHHADLLKQARQVQFAKAAISTKQPWWAKLFRRQVHSPALVTKPTVAPELG